MSKVNRVLVLFLTFIFLVWLSFLYVLQSRGFARLVSKKLTQTVKERLAVNIDFERIEFKLIPLGTILHNVRAKSSDEEAPQKHSVWARKIGFYFNPIDVWENRITLDELIVEDAIWKVKVPKDEKLGLEKIKVIDLDFIELLKKGSKEAKPKKMDWTFEKVQDLIHSKLPIDIKKISFLKTKFIHNDESLLLEKFSLEIFKKAIDIGVQLSDISILGSSIRGVLSVDNLILNAQLSSGNIRVRKFSINNNMNFVNSTFSINGKWDDFENWDVDGNIEIDMDLRTLPRRFYVLDVLDLSRGSLKSLSKVRGSLKNLDVKTNLKIQDLTCEFLKADSLEGTISKKDDIIFLDSFDAKNRHETARLINPSPLWHLKYNRVLFKNAPVEIKDLNTQTFLYSIREDLDPLFVGLTGIVTVSYIDDYVHFVSEAGEGRNLKLDFSKNENIDEPILSVPELTYETIDVKWYPFADKVEIKAAIDIDESHVEAEGVITKDYIKFVAPPSKVVLEEFGPISGVVLKGTGVMGLDIERVNGKSKLQFDLNLEDGEVLDLKLGDLEAQIVYHIEDFLLKAPKFSGTYNNSQYDLGGFFEFKNNGYFEIETLFSRLEFSDAVEIFEPISSDLKEIPNKVLGGFDARFRAQGKFDPDTIIVTGELGGEDVIIYDEFFDLIKSKFFVNRKKFYFEEITALKESGRLTGSFLFDRVSKGVDTNIKISDVLLSDLNTYKAISLGITGRVDGVIQLNGVFPKLAGVLDLKLKESLIGNNEVDDSYLSAKVEDGLFLYEGRVLGDVIKVDAAVNLNSQSLKKDSWVKFSAITDRPYILASILSEHNYFQQNITGNLEATGDAKFSVNALDKLDLNLNVSKLDLVKKNHSLSIVPGFSYLKVDNGRILNREIKLEGTGGSYLLSGKGELSSHFEIKNKFQFKADYFELFSEKVLKAEGDVQGAINWVGNKNQLSFFGNVRLDSFGLSFDALPATIDNLSGDVIIEKNKVNFDQFKGEFGGGEFNGSGFILIDDFTPEADLNFQISKSAINLFKRTRLVVDGEGNLGGKDLPYVFSGRFKVIDGVIQDELSDFSENTTKGITGERFIPKIESQQTVDRIGFDFYFESPNGVLIQNSMVEMRMRGEGHFVGSSTVPRLNGTFEVVEDTGKFLFKSSDFLISRGSLKFLKNDSEFNPEIYFQGNSRINEYDITLAVRGRAKDFEVDLSSSPELSQQDIFSLMTLGFTESQGQDLGDSDRQNLSGVGVGSILFDRFRINQGLKSSLGLRLSVSPEIAPEDTSLISQRAGTNPNGTSSRLRSATRIKVQKSLGEQVDLSVSSTVGGEIQQKQEMNLNYNIHKNFSVKGVYEVRSSEQEVDVQSPQSYGMDFIFRWNFK